MIVDKRVGVCRKFIRRGALNKLKPKITYKMFFKKSIKSEIGVHIYYNFGIG